MDAQHRAKLEARAFPEGGVAFWRARISMTYLLAVVLGLAGLTFVAALVFLTAVPTTIRYVRRELALGALMADERRTEANTAHIPEGDLREPSPPPG